VNRLGRRIRFTVFAFELPLTLYTPAEFLVGVGFTDTPRRSFTLGGVLRWEAIFH